ncbi:MAG: hypothetical protein HYX89_07165 [Chloroflexi bacterium]|nr:hypothetical protein [Chloroflexota bacterium]
MSDKDQEQPFEAYVDAFAIATNPYTVIVEFYVREFGILASGEQSVQTEGEDQVSGTPRLVARFRMSPQQAVVMAKLMYKIIKQYAQENPVELPDRLYRELGLEREWP